MRFLALLLAAAPLLGGCVNTDAAIFVAPTIDAPELTVMSGVLGTSVTGGFTLDLHLGARASGPSMVSLGEFSILDATKESSIVPSLDLTSGTQFPVTVTPDSDVDASLSFSTGTKTLAASLGMELCAAAGVVIGGTIQDSLQDTATQVDSDVIHASGCM